MKSIEMYSHFRVPVPYQHFGGNFIRDISTGCDYEGYARWEWCGDDVDQATADVSQQVTDSSGRHINYHISRTRQIQSCVARVVSQDVGERTMKPMLYSLVQPRTRFL